MITNRSQGLRFPGSWIRIALTIVLTIIAFSLLTGHATHVFGALPFALLFACPLLHVFMHRGHGGDGGSHDGPK